MHEFNAYRFHNSLTGNTLLSINNGSHHSVNGVSNMAMVNRLSPLSSTGRHHNHYNHQQITSKHEHSHHHQHHGGRHHLHVIQENISPWNQIQHQTSENPSLTSSSTTTTLIDTISSNSTLSSSSISSNHLEFSSLDYEPSNGSTQRHQKYQQHYYLSNNKSNSSTRAQKHQDSSHHHHHTELFRTDSGNSSLNTIDSISNGSSRSVTSSSNGSTSGNHRHSISPNNNFDCQKDDDFLLINVFVPEIQSEFDITCSYNQSIWYVKTVLIERCVQQGLNADGHETHCLNYGLFSILNGNFLDEQLTFNDYFLNNNSSSPLPSNNHSKEDKSNKNQIVRLEFLYKQRVKFGEIMSTLPLASATRKKRKRSRLLSAIQNGNLDKLAKALVNCDPNFVDEASGETPLSMAVSQPSTMSNATVQQIIVAIVNGGALLDFRTKDGKTALHTAVQKSNFIALKTLLDLGASPNYLDGNGLTPLYYSVIYKSNPKLTQLLLYEHASHGVTDQHGWQEVHHASKLGLVQHLEQLLFYGCDMNCRIVGSGNTSLHVAAINDQVECARTLLFRGCDTSIVNNSHQNAYQVAVIAGNMSLAEFIKNHKAENVVPYRDKPRYNPARRPSQHHSAYSPLETNNNTTKAKLLSADLNGGAGDASGPRSISPSWSQLTANTTTTSSGVCCEDEDGANDNNNNNNAAQTQFMHKQRSVMINNGNNDAQQQQVDFEDDDDDDDDDERDDEQNGVIIQSSESEDSTTFAPGMMVKAISDYNSGDPSHMQLRRNDHVLLLHSDHSPPTIASQKLLLGRRCLDGKEGFFPACCVEKIKPLKDTDSTDRVEGRRDMKMKNMQSATLPTRGRRGARKSYLNKNTTRQYQDRTVTLHRGTKGFGFVLRGAKDSSPILTKQMMQQQGSSSVPLIGLQYFDEIEIGGVADAAGLKRGDFLLAVNDVDVRHMSHENVVQLIRQSGDKVTMTIATPVPKQLVSILKKKGNSTTTKQSPVTERNTNGSQGPPLTTEQQPMPSSQSQLQMSQSVYASFGTASNKSTKAPPPAPPKRDPSTTLSTTSRARARSLVVASEVRSAHNQSAAMMLALATNEVKTSVDDKTTNEEHSINENSERSRSSRRISSYEPTEFQNQKINNTEESSKTKVMESTTTNSEPLAKESKRDSRTMSPPPNHSIINVTLSSKVQNNKSLDNCQTKTNEQQTTQNGTTQNSTSGQRSSLSSFQPTTTTNKKPENNEPQIPEPDYSSDEEDKNKINCQKDDSTPMATNNKNKAPSEKVKFTTKATVVLKSTSPCPPESDVKPSESTFKNGMIGSKNIFEELKEQSAKITSAARLRFAAAENGTADQQMHASVDSISSNKAPNNVKKNVAEFEKRLNGTLKDQLENQLRMSKSCMEEFAAQQQAAVMAKKELTSKPNLRQQKPTATNAGDQTDFRRNSIISAMAEKIAAVNQLVAEQQQQTGSKSLNSSPIPASLGKIPGQVVSGSTVVVQKPIAILPGSSATLTRRCVTVCEDPVKAIHLQQQHQQLRSQLAAASILSGGTLTKSSKPTATTAHHHHHHSSSLAETTSSILKQSSKSQTMRHVNQAAVSGSIDVVPPPPEFAASVPATARQTTSQQTSAPQAIPTTSNQQQKIYIQRQLQPQQSSSPITIQQQQQQQSSIGTQVHHHPHGTNTAQHSQLIASTEMPHPQHYSHQATHYHLHHHPAQSIGAGSAVSLSSSAPTSSGHASLMRQAMIANQQQPSSNYDFLVQQTTRATNPLISHHHHHSLSSTPQQIYIQQQQQTGTSQQNQLILQQRAIAAANAKLYQQQQQQQQLGRAGQYNTLASSKPAQQQIQYYITSQQQPPTSSSQNAQQQQYFATLSRHQHAQVQQQYLNSLTSQQQQMQQQQFATLTRHHQQQLLQPAQQQQNLANYNQLIQQQRQQQQLAAMNAASGQQQRIIQIQQSSATANRQTAQLASGQSATTVGTKIVAHPAYSAQQYHQQYHQQPVQQQVAYARKSVVEWTQEDVQEWLQRIGMAEHRMKFEAINGAKMLRLDNNSLVNIGVRQQQHRIYILEKLKQQIWQNHQ